MICVQGRSEPRTLKVRVGSAAWFGSFLSLMEEAGNPNDGAFSYTARSFVTVEPVTDTHFSPVNFRTHFVDDHKHSSGYRDVDRQSPLFRH